MGTDCFISYASTDMKLAEGLNERLTAAGFTVWFDENRLKPKAGSDWYKEIEAACEDSRIILPVLTPEWKKSEWTRYETYGSDAVIPVLFQGDWEAVKTGPLSHWQAHDLTAPDEAKWQALFEAVRTKLAEPPPEKAQRIANLRYPPNPYFVGRKEKLLEICEELHTGHTAALTQGHIRAITALGGVGKTTLANEYVHKFWRLYRQIFWVDARLDYESEFARIFDLLFPERAKLELKSSEKAETALRELSGPTERLLVIDNAEDEKSASAWIPKSGGCHTLITSRFTDWSAAVKSIPVYVLEPEPAREFLLKRTARSVEGDELGACDALAKKLGYLPLALEIAAAYIAQQGEKFGFGDYLRLYDRATAGLLSEHRLGSTEYPDAVIATWKATIEKLIPQARALLRVCSCMAATPIPFDMFVNGAEQVWALAGSFGEVGPAPADAEFALRTAAGGLKAFSMSDFDGEVLQFHPLVQTVEWLNATKAEQDAAAACAVTLLNDAIPLVEFVNWPLCAQLVPHAEAAAAVAGNETGNPLARLLNEAASYLCAQAQILKPERLFRRVLEIYEQDRESNKAVIASCLNNLAGVLWDANRLAEAEPLLLRALAIDEENHGPRHPDVAISLNNLAELLSDGGRFAEAEPLFRRAAEIDEASYGPGHPAVARDLNNLAILLYGTGRYAEAEVLLRRTLSIFESNFGSNDPRIAKAANNLGELLRMRGILLEAEELFRRALKIDEASLGPEHPDVAMALGNLANLLRISNRRDEAETLCRRALKIDEAYLGQQHPSTALIRNNLGAILRQSGRIAEAEASFKQALHALEVSLGQDHPSVTASLNNLGELYMFTGRLAEAEPMFRRALKLSEADLGPDHPSVALALNNLAMLLVETGKTDEPEELLRRAIAINEASLGPDHSDIAPVLGNLSRVLAETGRYAEAERLCRRALEISEASCGPAHPDVARELNTLAVQLRAVGRLAEAESLTRRAMKIDEANLGPEHSAVAMDLNSLALVLHQAGRLAEVKPLLRRALKIIEADSGPDHPNAEIVRRNLQYFLDEFRRDADAPVETAQKETD